MLRLPRLLLAFWYRPRLSGAVALCALLCALLVPRLGSVPGFLLAFDVASLLYLGSIAAMMTGKGARSMARRAQRHHDGRWAVLVFSLVVSGVVLLALRTALQASRHAERPDLLLAGCSIVLSWLFFGVVFAQTYAHADHIDRDGGAPALQFPGRADPDYWDYLYFALTLSMTFQTSDVAIAEHHTRLMVLLHAVVAFFFNVFIIALTVSAVGGAL